MTKRELIILINNNLIIESNPDMDEFLNKSSFPNIKDCEEEIAILKKEALTHKNKVEKSKNIIKNCSCNHEVRLKYYGSFGCSKSKCIFCGKWFNNCERLNDIGYSKNINKKCVLLESKIQEDEDGLYTIKDGYNKKDLYKIILKILKDKQDDEEIDLIEEFKKLDLKKCEIHNEPIEKEDYILIISGTNTEKINGINIYKDYNYVGLEFLKYFSELLHARVCLIDNYSIINSEKKDKYFPKKLYQDIQFTSYHSLTEFISNFKNHIKKIPFKLIIDLSDLYDYEIVNNELIAKKHPLDLQSVFKDSVIITINDLKKYYCNGKVDELVIEEKCDEIRKLLKKN